jgi:hypothetical protein
MISVFFMQYLNVSNAEEGGFYNPPVIGVNDEKFSKVHLALLSEQLYWTNLTISCRLNLHKVHPARKRFT